MAGKSDKNGTKRFVVRESSAMGERRKASGHNTFNVGVQIGGDNHTNHVRSMNEERDNTNSAPKIRRRRSSVPEVHNYPAFDTPIDYSGAWIDKSGNRKFLNVGNPHVPWTLWDGVRVGISYNHTPFHGYEKRKRRWPAMFEERCELEAKCRWDGHPVPKARSVDIQRDEPDNVLKLCERLERENEQMRRRLYRKIKIAYAKKFEQDVDAAVRDILNHPNYVSDPDLSDYSDS